MDLIPLGAATEAECSALSRLLRQDRRLREALGMPFRQAPRTARQVRHAGRLWCRRTGAQFFLLVLDGAVVGGLTLHPDRVHWYVGSAFSPTHRPRVGSEDLD